eukprot:gene175-biopygen6066
MSSSKRQLQAGGGGDTLHMSYITESGEEVPDRGTAHPSPVAGMGLGFYLCYRAARRGEEASVVSVLCRYCTNAVAVLYRCCAKRVPMRGAILAPEAWEMDCACGAT